MVFQDMGFSLAGTLIDLLEKSEYSTLERQNTLKTGLLPEEEIEENVPYHNTGRNNPCWA